MMKNEKAYYVSVIMSIYNEPADWLCKSIDSILDQTFSYFEFIIINDKPGREESLLLLEAYRKKDSRVVVIANEENIGLTKSLNKGIKTAKGKYIARMDADDIALPDRFEKQIAVMEQNPNIIVCGGKFEIFGSGREYRFEFPEKSEDIKALMIKQTCIGHPTVMIRKSVLTEHNILYDESFVCTQDYKLWADLYNYGDFYNVQDTLLLYRISDTQASSLTGKKQQSYSNLCRRKIIQEILIRKGYKGQINWDNLTTDTLKEIKPYNVPDRLKEVLYLSLKKYGLREGLYFILSLDYLHFSLRRNLAIICRFFIKREKLV
jgi:glycosyltransferase involved in cell wall biosynthesis